MTKNYFISMQKGFLALMSAALLFSCSSIEPFEMEDNNVLQSVGVTVTGGGDCLKDCIDPENPVYSVQTASISDGTSRTFEYKVYNTLTGFELDWIYSASNQGSRQLRITVSGAGFASPKTYTSNTVQGSGNGKNTFNFDAAWAACGEVTVRAEILEDGGVNSTQTTTYNLIGACPGCEDDFSAVLDCSNSDAKTLTVTFTAENAGDYVIQGGLTSGAVIGVASATAGFIQNTTHPSAGGPSNVTRWEGSLDDCETVTVRITYSGGNGVGSWSAKSKVDGVEIVNGQSVDQSCN